MPYISFRLLFIATVVLCGATSVWHPTFAQSNSTSEPAAAATPDPAVAKVNAVRSALSRANAVIRAADELQLDAERDGSALDNRCNDPAATEQTMAEFADVAARSIDINRRGLLKALEDAATSIGTVARDLTAAKNALPTAEPVHDDVKQANAEAKAKLEDLETKRGEVAAEKETLKSKLGKGLTCTRGLVAALAENLAALESLAADAKGDNVVQTLKASVSDLSQVISFNRRISKLWGSDDSTGLMSVLKASGRTDAELKPVNDAVAALKADTKAISGKFKSWLPEMTRYVKERRVKLRQVANDVTSDPSQFSTTGQSELKAGTKNVADVGQFTSGFALLESELSNSLSAADAQNISDAATELTAESRNLGVALTLLQDALGGDLENFDADQVSLFYFTDVRRLMQALNSSAYEVGGVADARARAEDARRELAQSELALAEAQGQVNTHQRRLDRLREEKRQAHAEFLSADGLFTTSSRKLDELKARPNKDERKIALAEQRKNDLQGQRDAAKERDEELSNEQNGLPAKIREAESDLLSAQERVRTSRADVIRLAITESEAFARARDNTPFLVAMPIAASSDPVKKVMMFAFNDSKTIFLRGNRGDLNKVKDIIAGFDRPSPQARMTLWTLELNSTADKKGTENFNEALESIESELANTRARIGTSLAFLRGAINAEVNRVANEKLQALARSGSSQEIDSDVLRWARLHLYQKEVRMRLGFKESEDPKRFGLVVTHFTLPDPAANTTLGEALMVLSLASSNSQKNIIDSFKRGLKSQIDSLQLKEPPHKFRSDETDDPHFLKEENAPFVLMRKFLGLDRSSILDTDTTSIQQEIIRAIQAGAAPRVLDRYEARVKELDELDQQLPGLPLADRAALQTRRDTVVEELLDIEAWMSSQFDMRLLSAKAQSGSPWDWQKKTLDRTRREAEKLNPLRKATARVAAADQMLKEMIIAVEDDLDRHFIRPMMQQLRAGLVSKYKGIGVGIVQRSSVLATNRGLARIDARGSAQLALGDQIDIIEGVQQLANLYLAGQTGNILSVLGGLNALPRKDNSELYGLTTGGVFKVTPIFDPSGQALRFQFDHVAATMVREPDGTTNPQLPRVERHTVNTEVQLSNMELREISRFNANAHLGLPKRTWGGLPIFNSIPWIRRNVPLIGWFVKKGGDAPFVQQSLIFGQTTMYPTIGDIMDLLRNPSEFDIRDSSTDSKSKKKSEDDSSDN